jgi:hypothetical protein
MAQDYGRAIRRQGARKPCGKRGSRRWGHTVRLPFFPWETISQDNGDRAPAVPIWYAARNGLKCGPPGFVRTSVASNPAIASARPPDIRQTHCHPQLTQIAQKIFAIAI